MTATAFNISMIIKSDVADAKAGLADVGAGLKTVETEAKKAKATVKQQADELDNLANAAAKAAMTQDDLAAAERRVTAARRGAGAIVAPLASPTSSTSAILGAWRGTETAAGSLQRAVAGLNLSIGSQAHDMVAAAQSTATYNRALDDIRASFNPLFAASRQYEQQLDRIADAEALGAINAREAAAARAQAVAGIMPAAVAAGPSADDVARQELQAKEAARASFNPLFAASKQYEQQLERIDAALRSNVISENEAAAARARAAAALAPMAVGGAAGPRAGAGSHHTANVAAQGFDIGVTAAMGMNPAMIGMQQGPQIAQVAMAMGGGTAALKGIAGGFLAILSPMNLAIIGMTAFAAYGIQALMKLGGATKSFEESMDALSSAVDGYEKNLSRSRMGTAELSREFGGAAEAVRDLLTEMAELDRRAAQRAAKDAFGGLKSEFGLKLTPMPEGDWLSSGGNIQQAQNRGVAESNRGADMQALRKVFGLDRSEEAQGLISAVLDAAAAASGAENLGLDEQIARVEAFRAAWLAAAEAQGPITEKADAQLKKLQEAQQLLEKQRALESNEAGVATARAMKGEIYQQVELERVRLQYGEDSAKVRAIENRHERESLKLKLDALGLADTAYDRTRAMNALQALQDQREKAALDARREWFRDQDGRIGAVRREISLIGASAAEQTRINALAEAEVAIRDRKMNVLEAVEARTKAILRAELEIEATRERALDDLKVAAQMDVYDDRIARAPTTDRQADLEAEKEFARQMVDHGDAAVADAAAQNARAKAIRDAQRAMADFNQDHGDRLGAIQRETDLIGASAAEQARVNALAQAEMDIRDRKMGLLDAILTRVRAIALAEAEVEATRKRALRDLQIASQMDIYDDRIASASNPWIRADIEGEKEFTRQMLDHGDAARASASAQRVRANAIRDVQRAQNDYLRDHDQGLNQLRLELALVGQTADVRARVLALAEAEQEIARQGLSGDQADMVRSKTLEAAELNRVIGEQADAWQRVQSAGEAAIDGVLDALRKGDVKDAMRGLLAEIGDGFFDLQVRNPLKNAILGTNLGTWEDVGGFGGIWGRMTGKNTVDEAGLAKAGAMATATMTVNAGSVIIGGNLSGIQAGLGGAANANSVPMNFAGLGGSTDVQSQVWQFFAAKGLKPHQIAGIMGNVSQESAFNPTAVGDGGDAFGLFQWNDRRHKLFDSIGGQQNLGDVQKQLEFAWQEMMTTEAASMQRLLASTDARGATEAFLGFERPQGFSVSNPSGAHGYDNRVAAAQAAEQRFATTVTNATDQVVQLGTASAAAGKGMGTLGVGMGEFGGVLGGFLQGAAGLVGGEKGGILGLLVGAGRQAFAGVPLFDRGGATADGDPSEPAGIVHKGEYVFDAITTRRIGVSNLDKMRSGVMRGFREGGPVAIGRGPQLPANFSGPADQGGGGIRQVNVKMDVSGRGDREIAAGVHAMIQETMDQFVRDALPGEVKFIINDRWGS